MIKCIPTLGSAGWISDMESLADYVISCFLATNRSQSTLHRTQNTSLQYMLKKNANNTRDLELELREVLTTKLQAVFGSNSLAQVTLTPVEGKPDQFSIRFMGIVTDGVKEYTIGKLVQFQDSRIVSIANINNG